PLLINGVVWQFHADSQKRLRSGNLSYSFDVQYSLYKITHLKVIISLNVRSILIVICNFQHYLDSYMSKRNGKPSPKKEKDFSRKIYKILAKDPNKSFNYKQIAAALELNDTKSRNDIIKELKYLASKEKIEETDRGKYRVLSKADYLEGTIDMTSRRTAY